MTIMYMMKKYIKIIGTVAVAVAAIGGMAYGIYVIGHSEKADEGEDLQTAVRLSLIHISEPTRLID